MDDVDTGPHDASVGSSDVGEQLSDVLVVAGLDGEADVDGPSPDPGVLLTSASCADPTGQ